MNVPVLSTGNAVISGQDREHVRSLFACRSGAEFGRIAHRVRTGADFVSRAAKRLGWTTDEELYAREALRRSVARLHGRVA